VQAFSLERMVRAVERCQKQLANAVSVLETAGIEYAITGGHAAAIWVKTVDASAVRNEPLTEIAVAQQDWETAKAALEHTGLSVGEGRLDVHLLPLPKIGEMHNIEGQSVLALDTLVKWCLERHRIVDKVYLRDLMDVGLVDATWPARYPEPLAERLQALLDDPLG
jgi:hypothetical protein